MPSFPPSMREGERNSCASAGEAEAVFTRPEVVMRTLGLGSQLPGALIWGS